MCRGALWGREPGGGTVAPTLLPVFLGFLEEGFPDETRTGFPTWSSCGDSEVLLRRPSVLSMALVSDAELRGCSHWALCSSEPVRGGGPSQPGVSWLMMEWPRPSTSHQGRTQASRVPPAPGPWWLTPAVGAHAAGGPEPGPPEALRAPGRPRVGSVSSQQTRPSQHVRGSWPRMSFSWCRFRVVRRKWGVSVAGPRGCLSSRVWSRCTAGSAWVCYFVWLPRGGVGTAQASACVHRCGRPGAGRSQQLACPCLLWQLQVAARGGPGTRVSRKWAEAESGCSAPSALKPKGLQFLGFLLLEG